MDLETLLTSRDGFGLESATFMQRARARILDGTPLDDLMARGTEHDYDGALFRQMTEQIHHRSLLRNGTTIAIAPNS